MQTILKLNMGKNDLEIEAMVDFDFTPGSPATWMEPRDDGEFEVTDLSVLFVKTFTSVRFIRPKFNAGRRLETIIRADAKLMESIQTMCLDSLRDRDPDYEAENYFNRMARERICDRPGSCW